MNAASLAACLLVTVAATPMLTGCRTVMRTMSTHDDVVVVKFNPDGRFGWSRKQNILWTDFAESIAVDPDANVYVGGYAGKDPSAWMDLSAPDVSRPTRYVTKYDSRGRRQWTYREDGRNAFAHLSATPRGVVASNSAGHIRLLDPSGKLIGGGPPDLFQHHDATRPPEFDGSYENYEKMIDRVGLASGITYSMYEVNTERVARQVKGRLEIRAHGPEGDLTWTLDPVAAIPKGLDQAGDEVASRNLYGSRLCAGTDGGVIVVAQLTEVRIDSDGGRRRSESLCLARFSRQGSMEWRTAVPIRGWYAFLNGFLVRQAESGEIYVACHGRGRVYP